MSTWSLSEWAVAICGVLYLAVAAQQAWRGQHWIALTYVGYAIANVGAVMIIVKGIRP